MNYVLDSPSLASTIDDVKHIFHDYDLTDRTTSNFKSTNTGLAVIRAQVALFKYHDNQYLINNTIKITIIANF